MRIMKLPGNINKRNTLIAAVISCFALIFASISLVNHYNFRTYAWDLGINNNAIYDYAHFRWNDCMLMQPQFENVLSDHLSLYPLLVSPFYWIFGSYTMLIFQIVAILVGGFGIYRYFLKKTADYNLSMIAMIHFLSVWGIYSALAFDYHDNVISAMLVPWLFLAFENKKQGLSFLLLFLICIGKENMALWAVFIALTLYLLNYKSPVYSRRALLMSVLALFYFVLAIKVIIPAIGNEGREYLHLKYKVLGNTFGEVIHTIIFRPQYVFSLLFENHTGWEGADFIKSELHFFVLLSGGFALFYKSQFILMILPIYAQKLFNDDFGKWGINDQYSIELVPVLTLALFTFLYEWNTKRKFLIYLLPCLITIAATASSLDHRQSKWYNPERLQFYKKSHYQTPYNVNEVRNVLSAIPANAAVSATNSLVPHLAFRDYIYQFPVVGNAEFIVILKLGNPYPLNEEELNKKLSELSQSDAWIKITENNDIIVFRRK
ncbi:MAG: DUF2079 domain-containing protein [Bacteroidia bacterium]|nr:DUF2079 domain-containing protein [Bacteroidia bacterium]